MCSPERSFYIDHREFLQQGDIFAVDLVSPFADEDQRIFRATDGRHGSVVLEGQASGQVFHRQDLDALLAATSIRSHLHTAPFTTTPDGHSEMVVAYADLFRFFVVATQTCDVSGMDKPALPWVIIVPATTLVDVCRCLPASLRGADSGATIHSYLQSKAGFETLQTCQDDVQYGTLLRDAFKAVKSADSTTLENFGRIKKLINKLRTSAVTWSLPSDTQRKIPEAYIDFSRVYTLPRTRIEAVKDRRIARIADPYRDQFAQKIGGHISRIASPTPMVTEEIR